MKNMLIVLVASTSITASVASQSLRISGPLAEKAPELCETRTKIRAFPFTITKAGSYVVARDIENSSGSFGLQIQASDVTIDLAGHVLTGDGTMSAIAADGALENITIRNGTLDGWFPYGVDLDTVTGVVLEDLVISNTIAAVQAGPAAVVVNCQFTGNGNGAHFDSDTVLHQVHMTSNTSSAGFFEPGLVAVACDFNANGGAGAFNVAEVVLDDCIARGNQGHGVSTIGPAIINSCTVAENNDGLSLVSANVVTKCSVKDNGGYGIWAPGSSPTPRVILDSSVQQNGFDGIFSTHTGLIRRNIVAENAQDGIQLVGSNLVTDNLVFDQGLSGIFATSTWNRVDHNNVTDNGEGVVITNSQNIAVRNKATLNVVGNFNITAGTWVGPISGAIAGATAWANFSF